MAGLRLLTKQEKAWFFLLCGDQPKINKLIFLILFISLYSLWVRMRFVISLRPAMAGLRSLNHCGVN
jgi:uncharacterized membrane protein